MCQISDSIFDVGFLTCQFCQSKCDITRPPDFRTFLQTAEECCNRNICGTFWKLGSLIKLNFDRYNQETILPLYICQISDSWFDVRIPTCLFYPSKCDITRPPDFQKFLQTSDEFCNKTFQSDATDLFLTIWMNTNNALISLNLVPTCLKNHKSRAFLRFSDVWDSYDQCEHTILDISDGRRLLRCDQKNRNHFYF